MMHGYKHDGKIHFTAKLGDTKITKQFLLGDICYDLETSEDDIENQIDEAYKDWILDIVSGGWRAELHFED